MGRQFCACLLIAIIAVGSSFASPPPQTSVVAQTKPGVTLQDGTPIRIRNNRNISSADAKVGETIDFEVLDEVKVGDTVVVPKGGLAFGTVTTAEKKKS